MSGVKKVSPLLDEFALGRAFSDHHGVVCYPAIHSVTNEKYILKCVSIPESQTQVDAMLLTGACEDRAAAQSYYEDLAHAMVEEAEALKLLSQTRGFAPFRDYQLMKKDRGQVGMDLWLLSPYRTTLSGYMKRGPLTHLEAVNLGIDVCAALTLCRKAGFVYQNLRPENIFITPQRKFQLGDLGLLALEQMSYAMLPDRYRSAYTAPELEDAMAELNPTMDLYSLGVVLFQIYNNGQLPRLQEGQPLPVPAFAGEELTAIIHRAMAPDPQDRWQSPEDMGQALVAYMQTNTVNDDPIISVAPQQAQEAQEAPETEEGQHGDTESDAAAQPVAPLPEAPAVDAPEVDFTPEPELGFEPTEELPEGTRLDQVEVPAGVGHPQQAPVADAEMVDILTRADAFLEADAPQQTPEAGVSTEEVPQTSAQEEAPTASTVPDDGEAAPAEEEPPGESTPEAYEDDEDEEPQDSKKRVGGFVVALCLVAFLALAAMAGYFFYTSYYCVNVDAFQVVDSTLDTLTVQVTTQEDNSLFTLSCQDTFGNAYPATLENGQATFQGLQPNTQYIVTLSVEGFHKLVGSSTVSHTTSILTEITSFTAVTGQEDGSAILTFTPNGTEPDAWSLTYSAPEEEPRILTFTGHSTTVTGLTVGKTYEFTLAAVNDNRRNDIYLSGSDSLTHVAMPVVVARNITVGAFDGSVLTLVWDTPETPVPVESWTIRCINGTAGEQTLTTQTCQVEIAGLDFTQATTLEITAQGMTEHSVYALTTNPIYINAITPDLSQPGKMQISWEFAGNAPESWLVMYYFGDDETAQVACQTDTPSVTIDPILPETVYSIQIQPANGSVVFQNLTTVATQKAPTFDAFGITAADIAIATFLAPDDPDWEVEDVDLEEQTSVFAPGQTLAFILEIIGEYDYTDQEVQTLILIRDENGKPVDYSHGSAPWHTMWSSDMYAGQLLRMPKDPGAYTLEVYFDGQLVRAADFTISGE